MSSYAFCLSNGRGVEKNIAAAAHYVKMSADQGHIPNMFYYGFHLESGQGVDQDYVAAAQYYKLSADGGYPQALWKYAL
jgi:TPR repeat protein